MTSWLKLENYYKKLQDEIHCENICSKFQLVRKIPFSLSENILSASSGLEEVLHQEFTSEELSGSLKNLRLSYSKDTIEGLLYLDFLYVDSKLIEKTLCSLELGRHNFPNPILDEEGSLCLGSYEKFSLKDLHSLWLELNFEKLVS